MKNKNTKNDEREKEGRKEGKVNYLPVTWSIKRKAAARRFHDVILVIALDADAEAALAQRLGFHAQQGMQAYSATCFTQVLHWRQTHRPILRFFIYS